jgi:hypothetical protein
MKNFLLPLILLAGTLRVKAQQKLPDTSPNLTLKADSNWYKLTKPQTSPFAKAKIDPFVKITPPQQNLTAAVVYDYMPVLRFNGHSKMPIVQTDVTGYTMPVVGMRLPRVYTMKRPAADTLTASVKPGYNLATPPVVLKPGN